MAHHVVHHATHPKSVIAACQKRCTKVPHDVCDTVTVTAVAAITYLARSRLASLTIQALSSLAVLLTGEGGVTSTTPAMKRGDASQLFKTHHKLSQTIASRCQRHQQILEPFDQKISGAHIVVNAIGRMFCLVILLDFTRAPFCGH